MNIQSWAFTAWKVSIFGVILVRIGTEHGEMLRISPYSIRIRENVDQKNAEYGNFLRSAFYLISQSSFSWQLLPDYATPTEQVEFLDAIFVVS